MVQTLYPDTKTNSVGTEDWLNATKGMVISAFTETEIPLLEKENESSEEKLFGTHLRELKEDVIKLLNR
jgi:hypothetical protein